MKLLFDARMVPEQSLHGIGRYALNLITWGLQHRPATRLEVLVNHTGRWDQLALRWPQLQVTAVRSTPFSLREQWELPPRVRRAGADLTVFPSLAAPLWCARPFVVTCHDLIPWHFGSRVHRIYFSTLSRLVCRRASCVISPSLHASEEAGRLLAIPAGRRRVVPEAGLGEGTQNEAPLPGSPYIVCVTNSKPHKNLRLLLQAWQQLSRPGLRLVLVAGDSELLREAVRLPGVERRGGISDAELQALYAGAQATVVPSLAEGFGLPALEAMECGSPVIAANATSLPEVVGGAGLLFDPHSVPELTACLRRVLDEPELRLRLCRAGRQRAAEFSWERCCRAHWNLFEEIIARG